MSENERISDSLRWYNESQGVKAVIKASTFDPILAINEVIDAMSHLEKDLCMCILEKECRCEKGDCDCAGDEYIDLRKAELAILSNCMCLCEFTLPDRVPFSRRANLRVFSLDKVTHAETPIIDILVKTAPIRVCMYSSPPLHFDTTEYSRRQGSLYFKFNYMAYNSHLN